MPRSPSALPAPSGAARGGRAGAIVLGLGTALLLSGCGSEADRPPAPAPAGKLVGLPAAATSERGRYRVAARPVSPVELHVLHDWIVRIELRDGVGPSEVPQSIQFDGGMPSHGHGFVTHPRVTENLGGGEFRVEGVKFHMPGAWLLRVTVTSASGPDEAELPVTIAP